MRDFFIDTTEKLIAAFIVLAAIVLIIGSLLTMFSGVPGSFVRGIAILVGGGIYLLVTGGIVYVAFGIYRNTQETNRLLAQLAQK